jgi:hypothetical protein
MTIYRKFYLKPGQQSPAGSTGRTVPDGGIVWIGDADAFPSEIRSEVMTKDEIAEFTAPPMVSAEEIQQLKDAIFTDLGGKSLSAVYKRVDEIFPEMTDAQRQHIKNLEGTVAALAKMAGLV